LSEEKNVSANDSGFSLTEALVSTLIATGGLLATVVLFASGARLQLNATNSSTGVAQAVGAVERLRALPVNAPERANGGSLDANVPTYFTPVDRATIRWTIADGPACGAVSWAGITPVVECAKHLTVVAVPANPQAVTVRLEALLWR
jgi:hypothetical protein